MSDCINCKDSLLNSSYKDCAECAGSNSICGVQLDSACVIYHSNDDKPTKLQALNMPNLSTAEQIFEAIDSLIGNGLNLDIITSDSSTIDFTTSGVAKHHLTASVKISSTSGNLLSINSDGLYATGGGLTNANNGLNIVSNVVKLGGSLIAPTTITTDITNTLTLAGLQTSTDSNFIVSDSGGKLSKKILTNILISSVNTLTSVVSSVSSSANIINTNVLSIDSGSGNLTSTINGVASTVSVGISPALTASNGLTKTINDVALGGTLTKNTSITGSYNLGISNSLLVGAAAISNDIGTAMTGFYLRQDQTTNGTTHNINASNVFNINNNSTIGFLFNTQNVLVYTLGISTTLSSSRLGANNFSQLSLKASGDFKTTVDITSMGSRRALSCYTAQIVGNTNTTPFTTGNGITDVAAFSTVGIYAASPTNPVPITNYYGFLIGNSNQHGGLVPITNTYGIFQEGQSDKNVFYGEISLGDTGINYGGTTATLVSSTTNTVTNKLRIKVNGTYYYLLASTSNS